MVKPPSRRVNLVPLFEGREIFSGFRSLVTTFLAVFLPPQNAREPGGCSSLLETLRRRLKNVSGKSQKLPTELPGIAGWDDASSEDPFH